MSEQKIQDELSQAKAEIAELKQNQAHLISADTAFKTVLDASPVPQALNDEHQNIIYINPAFTKTFGYELSDIPTLSEWWPKAYPDPEYRQKVVDFWHQHLQKSQLDNKPFEEFEVEIRCKDNLIKTIIAGASSLQGIFKGTFLVTLYDISKTRNTESELNQTATLLENVINSTPDLILVKNKQLQTILCNEAGAKAVGKSRQAMLGKTDIENGWDPELVNGNPQKGIRGFVHDDMDALAGINVHNPYDPANVGGKIRIFDSYKRPLRDADNEIIGLLLIARDVTERINTEEQLRRSQKMDALGKLTGGIAHDFNNMLGVILGYSELLQNTLANDSKPARYIEQIIKAGQRAHTLTTKLLAFSRNQPTEMKPWDINEILSEDQHMLEKTLTASIELSLNQQENLWPVCIDKDSFSDAVLNMSINAMHAMPDGGRLIITTRNTGITESMSQSLTVSAGDYVQVTIEDTGTGIVPEIQERIFEPFFSTKDITSTGLGLSQVYGFITQSNGDIQVSSEPNNGSRFIIYLPRYNRTDNEITVSADEQETSKTHQRKSILIVDDEPALRELSEEFLTQNNFTVFHAQNAIEALKILADEKIHLMLTDAIMPGINGYQLANRVTKQHPEIKIIIASGYIEINSPHENTNPDYRYLEKPYRSSELLKVIRELLG